MSWALLLCSDFLRFVSGAELPPPATFCFAFVGAGVLGFVVAPHVNCMAKKADVPPMPWAATPWVAGWLPPAPPGRAPTLQRAGNPGDGAGSSGGGRRCCTIVLVFSTVGMCIGKLFCIRCFWNMLRYSWPCWLSKPSLAASYCSVPDTMLCRHIMIRGIFLESLNK